MKSCQIFIQTCLQYNILQTDLHFPALNFQSLAIVSMGRHKTAFVIQPKSSWEQITNIGNPKKDTAADHYWISKSASFPRIPTAECFHRQNFRRSSARIEGNRLLHIGTILANTQTSCWPRLTSPHPFQPQRLDQNTSIS